jgi:YebC/PmpR family DNA-binding regulatory protein
VAGHSKWANIKHRKGRQDAKKGKIFAKLIQQITVAAKGGTIEKDNPKLRSAVEKALSANMTRDTINKAIDKGNKDESVLDEITYEGYGTSGVAFLVETLTDNKNRTAPEVRHSFSKCGGAMAANGSVSYLFSHIGKLLFDKKTNEEKLMDSALEAGADDVLTLDNGDFVVLTSFEKFGSIKDTLEEAGLSPTEAHTDMDPSTLVSISDKDIAEKIFRLIDMLEDLDDVQNVYTNADIDESCIED